MEKIYFDSETFIWKTKLNFHNKKDHLIEIVKKIVAENPLIVRDNYGYKQEFKSITFNGEILVENDLDGIINIGIKNCKELYSNETYNKINMDSWINIVNSKNPKQINFEHVISSKIDKYHNHVDIQKDINMFYPHFTWVYYIQMPDVMHDDDGVLYIRGKDNVEHWIRPEEDELIIMSGTIPHSPNNAPNANLDRIVLAGNVGFELIKKEKSFI
jgi:hypothetical protein